MVLEVLLMAKKAKKKTRKKTTPKKAKRSLKTKKKVTRKKTKKKAAKRNTSRASRKAAGPKPRGRPTGYEDEYAERVERYIARYLMDMKAVAAEFGVCKKTLNNWMNEVPKFAAAVKKGRQLSAEVIEHTLRKLAVPHDEVTVTYVNAKGKKGKPGKEVLFDKKVKKGVVNVHAADRILRADVPERFGNKIKHEGPVVDALANILSEMDGNQRGIPSEDSGDIG